MVFLRFIGHWYRSSRWDSFHSPYLFQLFTYACSEKQAPDFFNRIEIIRKKLIHSAEWISYREFGAGSLFVQPLAPMLRRLSYNLVRSSATRVTKDFQESIEVPVTIKELAKHSLSRPFQCRFMARLIQFSESKSILEFGTSLGISAAYMASASPSGQLITVEAVPEIAEKAKQVFTELDLNNILLLNKTFEEFLEEDLPLQKTFDLIFIDGNHRHEALLRYYHALKPHFYNDTILIIDDIYWSAEMYRGWKDLTRQTEVTQSVECFQFGLLFFNTIFKAKKNHVIRLP